MQNRENVHLEKVINFLYNLDNKFSMLSMSLTLKTQVC